MDIETFGKVVLFIALILLFIVITVAGGKSKRHKTIKQIKNEKNKNFDLKQHPDYHRVNAATFKKSTFLNKFEKRLYFLLCNSDFLRIKRYKVLSQVSLGEVINSPNREDYGLINAKRVDFMILDNYLEPKLAIEFNGRGHYQGGSTIRDYVKETALKSIGIPLITFKPGQLEQEFIDGKIESYFDIQDLNVTLTVKEISG